MFELTTVSVLRSQGIQSPLWIIESQLPEKCNEILFFLAIQMELLNKIKEFNSVFQRQEPSVMQIWRRVLYPPQWECLDRSFSPNVLIVNRLRLVESLYLKVMHLVVRIVRGIMTIGTLPLAEKDGLASFF